MKKVHETSHSAEILLKARASPLLPPQGFAFLPVSSLTWCCLQSSSLYDTGWNSGICGDFKHQPTSLSDMSSTVSVKFYNLPVCSIVTLNGHQLPLMVATLSAFYIEQHHTSSTHCGEFLWSDDVWLQSIKRKHSTIYKKKKKAEIFSPVSKIQRQGTLGLICILVHSHMQN